MVLYIWTYAVIAILSLGYYILKRKYSYWADRGVPFIKPVIPFGTLKGVGTTISNAEMIRRSYAELKGKSPIGGIFFFTKPVALVTDIDLLKTVFVKDFQYFQDRGFLMNEKDDPLSVNLLTMTGDQWKHSRNKISPTFTSGKLKMMHSTILYVANRLSNHLMGIVKDQPMELEVKDILARFTTDVIANVAFGIDVDSLANPENAFRVAGRRVVETNTIDRLKFIFTVIFPDLSRMLGFSFSKPDVIKFFMTAIKGAVDLREKQNIKRNDFLSLLVQIKNTGKLEGDTANLGKMSFNELASQVFAFFGAGFETSASTMAFALYELTQNPDVQEKAQAELVEVLERHDGNLTYEAVSELHYLDRVIQGK